MLLHGLGCRPRYGLVFRRFSPDSQFHTVNKLMQVIFCKNGFREVDGSLEALTQYAITLRKTGHDVAIITANPADETISYVRRLRSERVEVLYPPNSIRILAIRLLRRARVVLASIGVAPSAPTWWDIVRAQTARLLRKLRPDVIHIFHDHATPLFIRAGLAADCPIVSNERLSPRATPDSHTLYDELKYLLPLCHAVAAQTTALAGECQSVIPYAGPVMVVPNVIDLPARESLTDQMVVGFAGRLDARKGVDLLINAFSNLAQDHPAWTLRVAGEGAEETSLRRLVADRGLTDRIHFAGSYRSLEERRQFFGRVGVYVQASYAEGIPNSMLEAMSHGIPVIATAVSGIPESTNSDCAILVPPGDVAALREAIRGLLSDPKRRQRMGAAARQLIIDRFSREVVYPKLIALYLQAIDEYRRRQVAAAAESALAAGMIGRA